MRAFNIDGSKNKEFWYGHIVVLIATVLAVYLAASAGLQSAVKFELIKSDRDSYYMRNALLEEVRDNLEVLEGWGKEYRSGQARNFIGKPEGYKLEDYVWLTMQYSEGTFEIPGNILTGIRRYYSSAKETIRKMTSRQPAAKDVDEMLVRSKAFRESTLKALEADVNSLKVKLEDMGFEL